MVQKNFSIYGDASTAARLYIELGKRYLACWNIAEAGKILHSFEMFVFDEADAWDFAELLRVIALQSNLFEKSAVSTTVVWNNSPAVAVPAEYYNDELAAGYLALEGSSAVTSAVKTAAAGKLAVVYEMLPEWQATIASHFPAAQHAHKKALLFDGTARLIYQGQPVVQLAFYNSEIELLIVNVTGIQLHQAYCYNNAADVLYNLFNSLRQLGIDKELVTVVVGGLIDAGSALYKELALYITHLNLSSIDAAHINRQAFAEYPSHYFSPFYNLVV
ncbi:DUF3822 family protein [Foetidibacter luteolus]|uniref:DUF3822 family protein n=1 Tax=Foetidibacter luteolus TaxID=2608880 RepID=UPI00129BF4E0|nr:DUF3822 family protein [Foetidibacter luteolus]